MNEKRRGAAPRDRPGKATVRAVSSPGASLRPTGRSARAVVAGGATLQSLIGLMDASNFDTLECRGYTSLAHSPEVMTGVDTIARLVGSMTIHLMRNTPEGDVRVNDELARTVDVTPNRYMTRSNFVRWIVRTLYLEGNGNAVVFPTVRGGRLRELTPIPAAYCAYYPTEIIGGYRVEIAGRIYDPEDVLHFALNPGSYYPWRGDGYRMVLSDVANNLRQAAATEKGFMSSKWKPSIIVKVDALDKSFRGAEGRRKLLQDYVQSIEAGEPWVIPADQFSVEQVKPLTLSDLALADFVKLDKSTVATILGIPAFVLGVGEYKREQWNSFISTTIMPLAQIIQQELTRKLLTDPDEYFAFNPRSLMAYSLEELIKAGAEMVDRMAMRRNEWRDWLGLPPDPEMQELLALENYIPASMLGNQKKLIGGTET